MKHLTDEQLSRRIDGALTGGALAEAEAHLAACAECRGALAALAAQDAALKPALSHDPGERYFQEFSARVEDRIRAAGLSGAQSRLDRSRTNAGPGWFRSPRRLAWIGGVAAVVAGAALALVNSQSFRSPDIRSREISSALERDEALPPDAGNTRAVPAPQRAAAPPAPATSSAHGDGAERKNEIAALEEQGSDARLKQKKETAADAKLQAETAAPQRAYEVRRDARGEDVPAAGSATPGFARAPAAEPAPPAAGVPTRVQRRGTVEPLRDQERKALEGLDKSSSTADRVLGMAAPLAAGETPLCGEVVDGSGRAVANAQVVLSRLGRTATTDASGKFCVGAPAGDHELLVMAVGFTSARQQVHVGGESAEVRVIVNPVDVLGGAKGNLASGQTNPVAGARRPLETLAATEPKDAFATLPDSARRLVREAQRLSAEAVRLRRSAAAYDVAATAWEQSLSRLTGPAATQARYRLAESRYQAWLAASNAARRRAATQALAEYLHTAPTGPDRTQAQTWLTRISR